MLQKRRRRQAQLINQKPLRVKLRHERREQPIRRSEQAHREHIADCRGGKTKNQQESHSKNGCLSRTFVHNKSRSRGRTEVGSIVGRTWITIKKSLFVLRPTFRSIGSRPFVRRTIRTHPTVRSSFRDRPERMRRKVLLQISISGRKINPFMLVVQEFNNRPSSPDD